MILSSTIQLYFLAVLTLSKHVYDDTLIAVHVSVTPSQGWKINTRVLNNMYNNNHMCNNQLT